MIQGVNSLKRVSHEVIGDRIEAFSYLCAAAITTGKLKDLKWINPNFEGDPKEEIEYIKKSIEIVKKDNRKKMVITEYQFIAALMPDIVYSPSRTYSLNGAAHPLIGDRQFEIYKNYFINQIINNDVKIIYIVKPLGAYIYSSIISDECIKKTELNEILSSHLIVGCDAWDNN